MRMKICKTIDPQDWEKVNPNFIYNRYDLFCNEDEFEVVRMETDGNVKVLEYKVTSDQAELGLWLVPITEEELRQLIFYITKEHPNVSKITYKNGVIPYGKAESHNHYRIVFPKTAEEMKERVSSKTWSNMRRKIKRAEEIYGKMRILEYERENIPNEIVEAFFKYKLETRKRNYRMTASEYLDRYHVSYCYVVMLGDTISAMHFCCEQCPVAYCENHAYNPELKDYSLGKFVFAYSLIRMVERKHTDFFLAGGDYEYKKHYGSIEETLYDCEINVSELDLSDLIAQESLWGRFRLFLKSHLKPQASSIPSE